MKGCMVVAKTKPKLLSKLMQWGVVRNWRYWLTATEKLSKWESGCETRNRCMKTWNKKILCSKGWVTRYETRTKGHLKIDFKREVSDATEIFIYGRKKKKRAWADISDTFLIWILPAPCMQACIPQDEKVCQNTEIELAGQNGSRESQCFLFIYLSLQEEIYIFTEIYKFTLNT